MKKLGITICVMLFVAMMLCASVVKAELQPNTAPAVNKDAPPVSKYDPQELVQMLGDDDYEVRLFAEQELSKFSSETLKELSTQIDQTDLETTLRMKQILSTNGINNIKSKLGFFAEGKEASVDKDIPYWEDFKKIVKDSKETRTYYANMIRNEPSLFLAKDESDTIEKRLLTALFDINLVAPTSGQGYRCKNEMSFQSLIFLSCLDKQPNNNQMVVSFLYSIINHNSAFRQGNQSIDNEMTRTILDYWMMNAETIGNLNRFQLGKRLNLPSTMSLAIKMVNDKRELITLHEPICHLAQAGGDKEFTILVGLLNDTRKADTRTMMVNNKIVVTEIQVREIVLACLVKKSNQSLKEYGFPNIRDNANNYIFRGSINFKSDADRTKAFDKWTEWAKTHLNEKGEWIKKDTPPVEIKPEEKKQPKINNG